MPWARVVIITLGGEGSLIYDGSEFELLGPRVSRLLTRRPRATPSTACLPSVAGGAQSCPCGA